MSPHEIGSVLRERRDLELSGGHPGGRKRVGCGAGKGNEREAGRPGERVPPRISSRTLMKSFCCSLSYLHSLPGSLSLSWSLTASFLPVPGARWFTHLYSRGSGKLLGVSGSRAARSRHESPSVQGSAECGRRPHGSASAPPGSFWVFGEPCVCSPSARRTPRLFGKGHTGRSVLVCPAASSPTRHPGDFRWTWRSWGPQRLGAPAGRVAPRCPPCIVGRVAASAGPQLLPVPRRL